MDLLYRSIFTEADTLNKVRFMPEKFQRGRLGILCIPFWIGAITASISWSERRIFRCCPWINPAWNRPGITGWRVGNFGQILHGIAWSSKNFLVL